MHHIVATNFTHLSEEQLLFILQRRNHPEVRRWMSHPEPIAPQDHLNYCTTLPERPDILLLYVTYDGQPACVLSYQAHDASWQEIDDSGKKSMTVAAMALIRHLARRRWYRSFCV